MSRVSLRVGTFTASVLLELARRRGELDEHGLEVTEVPVTSSPAQFTALEAGELDVALTSPDNVLAYHFLTGNPLGRRIELRVLSGLDRGTGLSLWLGPDLDEAASLRGRALGVDVATSGFAFVAYALLEDEGLTRADYDVLALGSTPRRADALLAGDCAATVLNAGNELRVADRCRKVSDVTSIGPYLGTVVATTTSLTDEARHAAERLSEILVRLAGRVLAGDLDAETRDAAVTVLGLSLDQATRHVAVLRDPRRGLIGDGRVDTASIDTLLELRARYAPDDALANVAGGLASLLGPAAR